MASIQSSRFLILRTTLCLVTLILLSATEPSSADNNILYSGNSLSAGQSLSYGLDYRFIMQGDCNLVLYDKVSAVWSSGTSGRGTNCRATLETTGELAIHNDAGLKIWTSRAAAKNGHYVLVLQYDRNVVIYGGAIWATATNL